MSISYEEQLIVFTFSFYQQLFPFIGSYIFPLFHFSLISYYCYKDVENLMKTLPFLREISQFQDKMEKSRLKLVTLKLSQ